MQRAAFYLTVPRPDLSKPDANRVREMIFNLMFGRAVVELLGYGSFHEFSQDHEAELVQAISSWQVFDQVDLFSGFVHDLLLELPIHEDTLQTRMDRICFLPFMGHSSLLS